MSSRKFCGFNGCKNPIKDDATRCYLHIGATMAGEGGDYLRQGTFDTIRSFRLSPTLSNLLQSFPGFLSRGAAYAESVSEGLAISPEVGEAIYGNLPAAGPLRELLTPAGALANRRNFPDFLSGLQDDLGDDRVETLTARGLTRVTIDGKRAVTTPEVSHRVALIDKDRKGEVIVDPYIAAFAPVRDATKPVTSFIFPGDTPFTDYPWCGSLSEYRDSPFMRWNDFVTEQGVPL